jgi:O-antigen ligase
MRFAQGRRAIQALDLILALAAAGAMVGIIEVAMFGYGGLDKRPVGTLGHYMTFAGVLMLAACAAVARLLFYPERRVWPGVAVPALLVALALTLTINAYVGTAAAITTLVAFWRPRLLLVLPVVAIIAIAVAPPQVRNRVMSISPQQDSNRERFQMIEMGREIVRDHPIFGVGPEMIGVVYSKYLQPGAVHGYNPHLHNVPVQIAAERGLPALAVWALFIGIAFVGLARQLRQGPARALAGAGLAAVVAMLSAGLFEYNFGDSEFLIVFLGLITLPFAARLSSAEAPIAIAPQISTNALATHD